MADSTTTTAGPTSPRPSPAERGGRGHARNQSESQTQSDSRGRSTNRVPRGSRGGRGRGRGQGRDINNNIASAAATPIHSETGADQSYGRPPGGSFGARLTEAASTIRGDPNALNTTAQGEDAVADDVELCFICASPIEHTSIAPCNHQTCHICALRLRALYKTRACAHCRTEAPYVIFTDNAEKQYQDFKDEEFVKIDENLGVKYEKDVILEDTILLLRYNCPDNDCDVACLGWPDLHRHVKTKHGRIMCDLCTRNKKVFTHEHELFTFGELRRHEKFGDDNPGAVDQSGFKGHPECGFCRQRFYGDDELYTHCREKHERCHICDRRNGGQHPQYYLNYQELEKHFADAHFVCLDAECQANKTNVFESEIDLKAHQLSEHPNGLSKDARRDARLVSLSGFDLRTPYQPQRRGGGRENRGIGRGRDPNSEPLPVSSAQPLSRAELAYQRQTAIQSSQSLTPRTFGGSLTQSAPVTRPQPPAPAPQARAEPPSLDTLAISTPSTSNTTPTPQDQARTLRHQAVIERASNLLSNNPTKISQFRTHVSSYRSNTLSASALIDSFFSLFDCPSSDLGILVRELADLYENDAKRQQLLEAWNNWRSINEDYPSLPGPSGVALPTSSASVNLGSGRRVLKLKNSTQQSSRSAVSRQGSWGNALGSNPITNSNREAFPALASTSTARRPGAQSTWGPSSHTNASSSTKINTTPSTTSASRFSSNITSRHPPPTMSARQNDELFPSLPAAQKPNVMMAGFNTRGSVRWNDKSGSSSPNPWANGGAPTPAQAAAAIADIAAAGGAAGEENGSSGGGGGGKKKAKKGKGKGETLFHFG